MIPMRCSIASDGRSGGRASGLYPLDRNPSAIRVLDTDRVKARLQVAHIQSILETWMPLVHKERAANVQNAGSNGREAQCYVLENKMRVLSGRGLQQALGLGQGHGGKLTDILGSVTLKPFIGADLATAMATPIRFIRPRRGGAVATGYEATILIDICNVLLEAR